MTDSIFPPLEPEDWQSTRNIVQQYVDIVSKVRAALTPRQKHNWHSTLHTTAMGLTTTPIYGGIFTIEIRLDFIGNMLILTTSRGELWQKPLDQISPLALCQQTVEVFKDLGFELGIDCTSLSSTIPKDFSEEAIQRYWQAATQIDAVFKIFTGELSEETSAVQMWPQQFELGFTWFSGRRVPDVQELNPHLKMAYESIQFGFSTGDIHVPDPYFFANPDPVNQTFLDKAELPEGAFWNSRGFQAIVLKYETVRQSPNPQQKLLDFLRQIQKTAKELYDSTPKEE